MESPASLFNLTEEEYKKILEKVRAESEQKTAKIPDRVKLWLALAPAWTPALAESCNFPHPPNRTVREILQDTVVAQLCNFTPTRSTAVDRSESAAEKPEPTDGIYTMRPNIVDEVIQGVIRDQKRGLPEIQSELVTIGNAILAAAQNKVPVTDALLRWASLAAVAGSVSEVAWVLTNKCSEFLPLQEGLQAGSPSPAIRTGEALRWMEAAAPLERLLGGEISVAIGRAGRRLELTQRRAADELDLVNYLVRKSLVDSFHQLIDSTDEAPWAIHYVGSGGVGKTTWLRYINARLALERQISVARIDFDFLNPSYPSRAPGLLLSQIAEELRLYDQTGRASSLFSSFDFLVLSLHERLNRFRTDPGSDVPGIDSPDFQNLMRTFASAANELPKPILVMLDTCEELAKVRQDGGLPESVTATFTILEKMHELIPELRVIFCGRRPLASSGYRWKRQTETQQPARPYLRLFQMLSFTRKEAEQYLKMNRVPASLTGAILQQSVDEGYVVLFQVSGQRGTGREVPRYNPFQLAMFTRWSREDSGLKAEDITSMDPGRYVKARVIGRIHDDDLLAALPALALLQRFNRETLQAATQMEPERFARVFQEIYEQEWIETRAKYLSVEKGLASGLLKIYQREIPYKLVEISANAVAYLRDLTLDGDLDTLDLSHFDAALRLQGPADAARWWQKVEARIAREQAYAWFRPIIEWLAGPEGPASERDPVLSSGGQTENPLRAAIRATHAAVLLHTAPETDLERIWAEVAAKAANHPEQAGRRGLLLRALFGRAAALLHRRVLKLEEIGDDFWDAARKLLAGRMHEQLLASLLSALEEFVERCEQEYQAGGKLPASVQQAANLLDTLTPENEGGLEKSKRTPEIHLFICLLNARLHKLAGNANRAMEIMNRALSLREKVRPGRDRFLDWVVPFEFITRAALEFIRLAYPDHLEPGKILEALDIAVRDDEPGLEASGAVQILPIIATIDSDRLAAALLMVAEADRASSIVRDLAFVRNRSDDTPAGMARNVHQHFQPFFAQAAESLAARGLVDQAIDWLQEQSNLAEKKANALDVVLAASRAKLRIVRRFRLPESGYSIEINSLQQPTLADMELERAIGILYGLPLKHDLVPDSPAPAQPQTHFDRLSRGLREAAANAGTDFSLSEELRGMIGQVGKRRAAQIAQETGELHALVEPAEGVKLLNLARTLFIEARDPVGAVISGICQALALARAGRIQDITAALEEVKQILQKKAGTPVAVENFTQVAAWRPWFLRLYASSLWAGSQDWNAKTTQEFSEWLTRRSHTSSLVPTEFSSWVPSQPLETQALPGDEPASDAAPARRVVHIVVESLPFGSGRSRQEESGFDEQVFKGTLRLKVEGGQEFLLENQKIPFILPYREVASKFPSGFLSAVHAEIKAVIAQKNDNPPGIEFHLTIEVCLFCWEAIVLQGTEIQLVENRPAQFIRRIPQLASSEPASLRAISLQGLSTLLVLASTYEQEEMVRIGFAELEQMNDFSLTYMDSMDDLGSIDYLFASQTSRPATRNLVLHMFVTPVVTNFGVRLRIEMGENYMITKQAERAVSQDLFSTEQLIRRFRFAGGYTVALLVLQAAPLRAAIHDDARREQAAYLRYAAADLLRLGVPAVLVIPPLENPVGTKLIQTLAASFKDIREEGLPGLKNAVARARAVLLEMSASEELPFDLCLYTNLQESEPS